MSVNLQFAKLEYTYTTECDGRTIHTYTSCNAVPFVWGSLRLAPIIRNVFAQQYNMEWDTLPLSVIYSYSD